ncbi:MAG: phosphoenolpyruvate--protein phosphotransferase [Clostridia bacterium]|nr:phosphoenolpyruvate--protein phosphotransferase [Clostridia bacterium]
MTEDIKEDAVLSSGAAYYGIGVGQGAVCARLSFWEASTSPEKTVKREVGTPTEEWNTLQEAMRTAISQLGQIEARVRASLGEEEASIFGIHAMLLEDEDLLEACQAQIARGEDAKHALLTATEQMCRTLGGLEDDYLRARVADLRDVCGRVERILDGEDTQPIFSGDERVILVASDLSPSQSATLDRSRVAGFVTFAGSPNSHTAILARAMGIPALVGVGQIPTAYGGEFAILDARAGSLRISPSEEEQRSFEEAQKSTLQEERRKRDVMKRLLSTPAVTGSGHRILIYANIGEALEAEAACSEGADGVGLLRSEFLYLRKADYPTEEELFEGYAEIARRLKGKRTVIRTLDAGADKQIPYLGLEREENPALGVRGIRVCLARRELFQTQLCAILRASAYGQVCLMLPMVVSVDEVRQARSLLLECMRELDGRGQAYDKNIEFGIMIETPAAAIMSEELAREVDFFSVGTNDLLQYTLAADRQNPTLAPLLARNQEPILRLIEYSAAAIHRTGGWIGICGELAADPSLTQRFADMHIDELSVSVPQLLAVRDQVLRCK